jgi:beta-glucosidase
VTDREITDLVAAMTPPEKRSQLAGRHGWLALTPWTYRLAMYRTPDDRLRGIRGLRFTDGPRGVNLGRSTAFPAAIARGATWDPELEELVGAAMGREAAARGANALGSTCVEVIRHPGWGRAQETFGADPVLIAALGAAHVRGVQRYVMAVVKHVACNSIERSRFRVDVRVSEPDLHEHYLPPVRACLEAGAAAIMTAYNTLNGVRCSEQPLLAEVVRGQWGFDGLAMSDFFFGVRSTRAVARGVDVEMPRRWHYGPAHLARARRRGTVCAADVDAAVTRVLRTKRRFGLLGPAPPRPAVDRAAHEALALEAARRSVVLLRNHAQTLPLDRAVRHVLVTGPFATTANLGSEGSCSVRPPSTSTLLEGLRAVGLEVEHDDGRDPARAAARAAAADAAIVTAGIGPRDEGEYFPLLGGGDRTDLGLRPAQEALLRAVNGAQLRTIGVLYGGSAIACGEWADLPGALLMAWYPGMRGGRAVADLLVGAAEPSGRLPLSFPDRSADAPPFDPRAAIAVYDDRYDYRDRQAHARTCRFPFGHGLSYTEIAYRTLDADLQRASVVVENVGSRAARETVQLYVTRPRDALRRLAGFAQVDCAPGERVIATIELPPWVARRYAGGDWVLDPGTYVVEAGPSSGLLPLRAELPVA